MSSLRYTCPNPQNLEQINLTDKEDLADLIKSEMGRLSWIMWMDKVKSQGSLSGKDGGRRMGIRGDVMKQAKVRGGNAI